MKRMACLVFLAALVTASCSKEFTKKHKLSFKANGTQYTSNDDQVSASYVSGNSSKLSITSSGTPGNVGIIVNLGQLNQDIALDSTQSGFYYTITGNALQFPAVSGEWKITSYDEGNPSSRHTEGTFSFIAVNPSNQTDTVRITDGTFYVNNY